MKTSRKHRFLLVLALAACATGSGVDSAEEAASLMREANQALKDAPGKITAVTTSLDTLSKEGGDMKAEFKAYGDNIDALVRHRDYLRSLGGKIDQSRTAFTAAWEKRMKEIKNEDMRKRAEERRAALNEQFAAMKKTADAAKVEFDPWLQTVLDVRTYLENDLNPTGVASVKDQVRKIRSDAGSVNKKLNSIVESLAELTERIAATKPPEPEPAAAPAEKK